MGGLSAVARKVIQALETLSATEKTIQLWYRGYEDGGGSLQGRTFGKRMSAVDEDKLKVEFEKESITSTGKFVELNQEYGTGVDMRELGKICKGVPMAYYHSKPRVVSRIDGKGQYCYFFPSIRDELFEKNEKGHFVGDEEDLETYCRIKFGGHLISVNNDEEISVVNSDVFGDFSATRQFDMLVYAGLKIREEDQQEAAFTDGTNDSFVNARAFLRKDAYHPLCLYFKRYYKDKIDAIVWDRCGLFSVFVCKSPLADIPPRTRRLADKARKSTVNFCQREIFCCVDRYQLFIPSQSEYNVPCLQEKIGLCQVAQSKSPDFKYKLPPPLVKNEQTGESYCLRDLEVTREIRIENFHDAESFCKEYFNGHLLSVADKGEMNFLVLPDAITMIGWLDLTSWTYTSLVKTIFTGTLFENKVRDEAKLIESRMIGLTYTEGRGIPSFTDGTDPIYAFATSHSEKTTLDYNGNCFALVYLIGENRGFSS
ncbi:unnamed protein product [Enterobius vermicularis]|uniref:Wsv151 n=1 Tax=Enterobius vermicularis TaxID=51028 RepID=A0A0N4UV70_ENTVE|nr:unnamed protein product [Enterobius vermicularis]